jgi:hypothetical protein
VFVNVTGWLALAVPTLWLAKVRLVVERLAPGPEPAPVPARLTDWVPALSVMIRLAVRDPAAAGLNVTLIAQLAPAATDVPQLLAAVKSPAFVPVTATLEKDKVALPVLVNVTGWLALAVPTLWLAKVRLVVERLTTGAEPVPARLTDCVPALPVITRLAVRDPAAAGSNETLIVQLAPAETGAPQPLARLKSLAFVPVTPTLERDNVALPVFVSVTGWLALVVATLWLAKVRLVVERLATGPEPAPVPARLTDCVPALSVMIRLAVREPLAPGSNVTPIAQLAPAETGPLQ